MEALGRDRARDNVHPRPSPRHAVNLLAPLVARGQHGRAVQPHVEQARGPGQEAASVPPSRILGGKPSASAFSWLSGRFNEF